MLQGWRLQERRHLHHIQAMVRLTLCSRVAYDNEVIKLLEKVVKKLQPPLTSCLAFTQTHLRYR